MKLYCEKLTMTNINVIAVMLLFFASSAYGTSYSLIIKYMILLNFLVLLYRIFTCLLP